MTRTTLVTNPQHDPHYRTTYHMGPNPEVFVEVRTLWQAGHLHWFSDLSRFGDAACHGCGATAWSAWWVAEDVFGENTHKWMVEQERIHRSLIQPVPTFDAEVERVLAIVAVVDGEEPANGRARAGIPVPKMRKGHLTLY